MNIKGLTLLTIINAVANIVLFIAVTMLALTRYQSAPVAVSTTIPHSLIAKVGEWVTNPAGNRVCRLTQNLSVGMIMRKESCSDWQGPPVDGQAGVDWLRIGPGGGGQIMIEGQWRP